ncbi:MAG TPA: hemerythrin domain-containing protein [Polyangiaceae bacterium]|jgi:hemerythrin superfamily protein|nr:hemerythrin domain-containing protein [Polyangiaceae bacterium]
MKATSLLQEQHRHVEQLFDELEKGQDASLLRELANVLSAHMAIEQNIFYPAVREADPELIDESYQEHAMAELALKRLLAVEPRDPTFNARMTTLEDLILNHVDEEENQLFPSVERKMDAELLESLGDQLEQAFLDAKAEGFDALVPSTFARTSADEALASLWAEPSSQNAEQAPQKDDDGSGLQTWPEQAVHRH